MSLLVPKQRLNAILALGLPIIGGMISQSILNLVDTAMVGSLGEDALAGVGIGSYANFMAVALVMGLSSGVQAMVARRKGEEQFSNMATPLNGALLLAAAIGIPLVLFFFSFAPELIALLNNTEAVQQVATPYFEYRSFAILAVGLNFSFRGYWNGINRSVVYLRTLVIMHVCNVIISYGLIFGHFGLPEMGAPGAGLGTTIALYIGSLVYAYITIMEGKEHGFMRGLPDKQTMATMLRLSIPNSLQQFFFASSFAVLFWIIGQVGVQETAVAHVLINLALFLILPGVGFGMAATTLVSEALGRKEPADAYRWGWDVVKVATCILAILGIPMWLMPEYILSIFIRDQALIELGVTPLRITGMAIALDAAALVFTQALLGAGANKTVMKINIIAQWGFFLPAAWLIGPYFGFDLLAIWLVQFFQRGGSSLIFAIMWRRKHWIHIKL